jgi:hypothetical protein
MRWSTPVSGQATAEAVGLALAVAVTAGALAATLVRTPVAGRLAGAVRAALAGPATDPWGRLPASLRLIASRAVVGAPGAPTVTDAVGLLADELGLQSATALIDTLARDRLIPLVIRADGRVRRRSGRATARVVTPADERRLAPLVRRAAQRAANRRLAATLLATAIGVGAGPEAGVIADLATFLVPGPGRALPPAAEAGDLVLCVPVWRRPAPRAAERAGRLIAVVRGGRVLTSAVSDARTC